MTEQTVVAFDLGVFNLFSEEQRIHIHPKVYLKVLEKNKPAMSTIVHVSLIDVVISVQAKINGCAKFYYFFLKNTSK